MHPIDEGPRAERLATLLVQENADDFENSIHASPQLQDITMESIHAVVSQVNKRNRHNLMETILNKSPLPLFSHQGKKVNSRLIKLLIGSPAREDKSNYFYVNQYKEKTQSDRNSGKSPLAIALGYADPDKLLVFDLVTRGADPQKLMDTGDQAVARKVLDSFFPQLAEGIAMKVREFESEIDTAVGEAILKLVFLRWLHQEVRKDEYRKTGMGLFGTSIEARGIKEIRNRLDKFFTHEPPQDIVQLNHEVNLAMIDIDRALKTAKQRAGIKRQDKTEMFYTQVRSYREQVQRGIGEIFSLREEVTPAPEPKIETESSLMQEAIQIAHLRLGNISRIHLLNFPRPAQEMYLIVNTKNKNMKESYKALIKVNERLQKVSKAELEKIPGILRMSNQIKEVQKKIDNLLINPSPRMK